MLQQKLASLGQPAVTVPYGIRVAEIRHSVASSSNPSPPTSSADGYMLGAGRSEARDFSCVALVGTSSRKWETCDLLLTAALSIMGCRRGWEQLFCELAAGGWANQHRQHAA
jgi:hypothetical protein